MHDSRTHPLLEQVPLTVSPFISLPTATTLPYTYRAMPSTLPPSSTGTPSIPATATGPGSDDAKGAGAGDHNPQGAMAGMSRPEKPRYVVSASGHAAHPDDIIASCRALQDHLAQLQADADAELRALDERIRERELAEKRRVAPGWLDSDERLLEPERRLAAGIGGLSLGGGGNPGASSSPDAEMMSSSLYGPGFSGARPGLHQEGGPSEMAAPEFMDPGSELDRAFGGR